MPLDKCNSSTVKAIGTGLLLLLWVSLLLELLFGILRYMYKSCNYLLIFVSDQFPLIVRALTVVVS